MSHREKQTLEQKVQERLYEIDGRWGYSRLFRGMAEKRVEARLLAHQKHKPEYEVLVNTEYLRLLREAKESIRENAEYEQSLSLWPRVVKQGGARK
jgi:hypothetical protein